MKCDEDIPHNIASRFRDRDILLFQAVADLVEKLGASVCETIPFSLGPAVLELIVRESDTEEMEVFDPFNVEDICSYRNQTYWLSILAVNGYLQISSSTNPIPNGPLVLAKECPYINYFHVGQMNGLAGNHAFSSQNVFLPGFAPAQYVWPRVSPPPTVSQARPVPIIASDGWEPLHFGQDHVAKYVELCGRNEPNDYDVWCRARGMTKMDDNVPNLLADLAAPNFPLMPFHGSLEEYDNFGRDILKQQAELSDAKDSFKPMSLYSKGKTKLGIEMLSGMKTFDVRKCLPVLWDSYMGMCHHHLFATGIGVCFVQRMRCHHREFC